MLEFTIDPAASNLHEILEYDLPHTAAYPRNESTEVLRDDEDPSRLTVVTRWTTAADLSAYTAWRQSPEGTTRLAEIATSPPSSRHFSIQKTF